MYSGPTTPPVVFDPAGFVARYPEFAALTTAQLTAYFSEACLYCANSTSNPAYCAGVLPQLLNMMTAHVAWLYAPQAGGLPAPTGSPASPLVGRITNASEGTVSVATANDYPPGSVQWYQQTTYGASYWAATAQFRTMQYRTSPRRLMGGWGAGFGRGGLS